MRLVHGNSVDIFSGCPGVSFKQVFEKDVSFELVRKFPHSFRTLTVKTHTCYRYGCMINTHMLLLHNSHVQGCRHLRTQVYVFVLFITNVMRAFTEKP